MGYHPFAVLCSNRRMTNLSSELTELQALEADIELSNRISLHKRLNRVLGDPNSTIDEIKELITLLSQMIGDYTRRTKALTRERELALGELRLEVRQEAMALQRAKMELDEMPTPCRNQPTNAASSDGDPEQQTETAEPPRSTTNRPAQALAVVPKYTPPTVVPATVEKSPQPRRVG